MIPVYYQDEWATIYHGDCREIMPIFPDASIDLVLTDPPYGHNNNNGDLIHNREKALGQVKRGEAEAGEARPIANDSPEETQTLVAWLFPEIARLLKPGCCCCCCCGGGGGPDPQFARWSLMLDEAIGFKHAVVWDKGGLGMGWHYRRNYEFVLVAEKPGAACNWHGDHRVANVMRFSGIKPTSTDHPTVKPLGLFQRFVGLHSAPGETVLDPLMGSGIALSAAKDLGRKSIGIELDERWCEIAARRLAERSANQPEGMLDGYRSEVAQRAGVRSIIQRKQPRFRRRKS